MSFNNIKRIRQRLTAGQISVGTGLTFVDLFHVGGMPSSSSWSDASTWTHTVSVWPSRMSSHG